MTPSHAFSQRAGSRRQWAPLWPLAVAILLSLLAAGLGSQRAAAGSDGVTILQSSAYQDDAGRVSIVGELRNDSGGEISLIKLTATFYDAAGNVERLIDPLDRITSFAYDAADRLLTKIEAYNAPDAARTTRTTTYLYDDAHNLESMTTGQSDIADYRHVVTIPTAGGTPVDGSATDPAGGQTNPGTSGGGTTP